jgi:hypothetical protein
MTVFNILSREELRVRAGNAFSPVVDESRNNILFRKGNCREMECYAGGTL